MIDNRRISRFFTKETIVQLCQRSHGIGADGLILLENALSANASYRMRIFNADGSEAEMCGNGLRCLAHYIRSEEKIVNSLDIETMHQILNVSFPSSCVRVCMPAPSPIVHKKIEINQNEISLYCLDTGVPHAVYFTDPFNERNFLSLAPLIRSHPDFQPEGTNVNLVQILSDQSIAIRTYERGVENETLACGTGAAASAITCAHAFSLKAPITVEVRSGERLIIDFQKKIDVFTQLTMTGPAEKIFEGKVILSEH